MSDQKMQECFEFFYDLKWEQVNDFAQQAWKAAWLASRETMVINLPKTANPCGPDDEIYWPQDVFSALESAGLKVKP